MTSSEPRFVSASRHGTTHTGRDGDRVVVWLRGEHDIATSAELSADLARAVALDESDLVVDLSEVQFMDASTIGVVVTTRNCLLGRSRSLSLRAPASHTRRILEVCGLAELIDAAPLRSEPAGALGSWVSVPAGDRADHRAGASVPAAGEITTTSGEGAPTREGAAVCSAPRGP
jgi:anti-sigma B factor antagonist